MFPLLLPHRLSGPQLRLWSLRFGDLLIAMNVNLRSVIGERV